MALTRERREVIDEFISSHKAVGHCQVTMAGSDGRISQGCVSSSRVVLAAKKEVNCCWWDSCWPDLPTLSNSGYSYDCHVIEFRSLTQLSHEPQLIPFHLLYNIIIYGHTL